MRLIIAFNNKNWELPEPWVRKAPAPNEIWYTSTDGNIVELADASALPTLISNTYINGCGIMTFATNVINIGLGAFGWWGSALSKLYSMELPTGVETIGSWVWYSSTKEFTNLILPNTITSIGNYITAGSPIESITYLGTMSEWNNINISGAWRNYSSLSSVVCTDGTILY